MKKPARGGLFGLIQALHFFGVIRQVVIQEGQLGGLQPFFPKLLQFHGHSLFISFTVRYAVNVPEMTAV
jgi:hypothetical protein